MRPVSRLSNGPARWARPLASVSALLWATACNWTAQPNTPPEPGQTDFVSAGTGAGNNRSGDVAAGAADSAAGAGTSAAPRTVEEGDIFKKVGDTLYVLNPYRGLQIVDVSNPDQPVLQGRSRILGHPVEMYVRDGYAYLVVSDYYSYWQQPDGATTPFHGSQIRVVDVRVPSNPVVVGGIDLEGAISDTRVVGDVLYVVSNRYAWYSNPASGDTTDERFVASIDLSNRAAPQLVERMSFPGTSSQIHVSQNNLYVASPQATSDWRNQQTEISRIDISDPAGDITPAGALQVEGSIEDRSQMDEFGTNFRVVSHTGGWGQDGTQRLTVLSIDPAVPGVVGGLVLPNTGGLFATRFDGDRAYLVTMVSIDPLEVVDLRDPTQPVLTHSLVIPGVLHHVEARGDRLLALGTDDRWSGVAASLFDVADPRNPMLLSRVRVGTDTGHSWSNANWDDKALRVLDSEGMMLVPFSAWDEGRTTGKPRYINGFQIIDFDRQQLAPRGIVEQEGQVSRLTSHSGRLLSISDRVLQSIDATDRSAPRVTGRLELARDVSDVVVVNGAAVTVSTSGWTWESDKTEVRISPLGQPESGSIGRVELPFRASRIWADGDGILVAGWPLNYDGTLLVARVSLANPAQPQVGAAVQVGSSGNDSGVSMYPDAAVPFAPGKLAFPAYGWRRASPQDWESWSAVAVADTNSGRSHVIELDGSMSAELIQVGNELWTGHQEAVQTASGPALSRFYVDRIAFDSFGNPVALPKVNVPGTLVGAAESGRVLFTRDYQWNSSGNLTNALAELSFDGQRASLTRYLTLADGVGRVFVDGRRLYATTQNWWWSGVSSDGVVLRTWTSSDGNPLHEASTVSVPGWYQLRTVSAGHLFLGTGYYGGPWECGMVARGGAAVGDIAVGPGFGYWSGPSGLLVYSRANPDQPAYERFVRTQGWVNGLSVSAGNAYAASGVYGIETIPLTTP